MALIDLYKFFFLFQTSLAAWKITKPFLRMMACKKEELKKIGEGTSSPSKVAMTKGPPSRMVNPALKIVVDQRPSSTMPTTTPLEAILPKGGAKRKSSREKNCFLEEKYFGRSFAHCLS